MQIIKRRLKNALNNKILKSQLMPYNIFYIVIDPSQTITNSIKKKNLTKLLFSKNFNLLKDSSFVYPICYASLNSLENLLNTYSKIQKHDDFKKILICAIQNKSLIFKDINTLYFYNFQNNILTFYKMYFMLNFFLINFIFSKKTIK